MPHLPYIEAAKRLNEALTALHESGPSPAVVRALRNLTCHPHQTIQTWAIRGLRMHDIPLTEPRETAPLNERRQA